MMVNGSPSDALPGRSPGRLLNRVDWMNPFSSLACFRLADGRRTDRLNTVARPAAGKHQLDPKSPAIRSCSCRPVHS